MSCLSVIGSNEVFEKGKYKTVLEKVDEERSSGNISPPPKEVLICRPSEEGEFPVLLFSHGYLLYNSFYSLLFHHLASHGFILIAPQLYTVAGPDSSEEVKSTAKVANWVGQGLQSFLPPNVKANLDKIALVGHSRGGKTSFALALSKEETSLKLSALIAIDPVDGMGKGKQTPPPILTYVPGSFDLGGNVPIMVVGSGLGDSKRNPLFPPCAPKGVNHEDFFRECKGPCWYFVVKDYGHLDMLDDETSGVRGRLTYCLCKNGESREPMRRFVGGVVVAFMRAYLEGDFGGLMAIRDQSVALPVELQTIKFRSS